MIGGHSSLRRLVAVLVAGLCLAFSAGAQEAVLDPRLFPRPEVLAPNVQFWTKVYSVWTSNQGAFHDERHLDVVYEVIDLPPVEPGQPDESAIRKIRRDAVEKAQERIESGLRRLSRGPATTTAERELESALARVPGGRDKFATAAQHVRLQTGLRNRFADAVVVSGLYMDHFEKIFREQGIPPILSRLPFVESMFVNHAHSKVGAVGTWQFMPATARLYMDMSAAVDARVDPLLAATGAATMLRHDFETLESWPLALTAYNHGRGGMSRAVREVGSRDIGEIVSRYRSRRFGFASRNFYAEFLAAADVYQRRAELFPNARPAQPLQFEEFELPRYVSLLDLAEGSGAGLDALKDLNPALHQDVFNGTMLVPRAYPLRVPAGRLADVRGAYDAIPADRRRNGQLQVGYQIRPGDTVGSLARRFGTTVGAIQRANSLSRPDKIYVGQYLNIPGQSYDGFASGTTTVAASATTSTASATHTVQRGENLSQIARRFGRSVDSLVATNGLASADTIHAGQRLRIPALSGDATSDGGEPDGGPNVPPRSHTVRRGDSLAGIARSYGVSVDDLRSRNALRGTIIHPGQLIEIP